jgi:hypothetical protein
MSLPIYSRKFRSFMSTFHVEGETAEQLEGWLVDEAGVSILRDSHAYVVGPHARNVLESSVELCQSMIILLSQKTIESGWVKEQFEVGLYRQKVDGITFRIVPIRIDDCDIPDFLKASRWLDLSAGGLSADSAAKILFSLYSVGFDPVADRMKDVYFIRSWAEDMNGLENTTCNIAKNFGFRLIASSGMEQFDVNSTKSIVSGCGGGIAVIPRSTSGRMIQKAFGELEVLRNLKLPYVVVAHNSISLPTQITQGALAHLIVNDTDIQEAEFSKKIVPLLGLLQDKWLVSSSSPYIFYGTDLKEDHKNRNRLMRQVIQQIVSLPCVMGEDIQQGQVQQEIINRIVNAQMMVADISKENLNTCIEAGIALGANVPVFLVSGDERHKPPFMFRDRQIWHYQNELDLLGIVHKLALPYRRLII